MLAVAAVALCVVGTLVSFDLAQDTGAFLQGPKSLAATLMFATPVAITAAHLLLGIGAALAFWRRQDVVWSRRIVLVAFFLSLPLQVLPRIVPTRWYVFAEADVAAMTAAMLTLGGFVDLLPLLLSVTVGVSRGGMRQMLTADDGNVGATLAFLANLQMALILSITLALLEPLGAPGWLLAGAALATLHHSVAATICCLSARGRCRPRTVTWVLRASLLSALLPGMAMIGQGLYQTHIGDYWLVGFGDRKALYPPSHLVIEFVQFVGRAAIAALAAHDLLTPRSG